MKRLYLIICLLLVSSLAGGLFISCSTEQKPSQPVILKMASAAMADYVTEEQAFADRVNARTGGDYKIEYYPSEQMIKFPELLDAVRTGAAEMAALTPNAASADEPKLGAVEIPFLFNNVRANAAAIPQIEPIYGDILEKQFNQKLLCLHQYTGLELFSTKPMRTLDDWKGRLVQSLSPVCTGLIQAMGGSAVAIPYTESYEALQKGVAEAVMTAPAAARIFKLNEVAPNMSAAYYISASHGFTINLDTWNKLPKKIQDIILEEAKKSSDTINEWLIGEWQKDFDALAASGVTIYTVPAAERDKWKQTAKPFIDSQVTKMGDVGQKVLKIADEANSKNP
jgi:TRAP-type C4-dicarboxylate transport system substrate-binding protein